MPTNKTLPIVLIATVVCLLTSCMPKMAFMPPPNAQMGGPLIENPCRADEPPETCIASQRPNLRLSIPGQQTSGRISPDGSTLIAALGSALNPGVAAFDLNTRRGTWRVDTVADWGASLYDYFFIDQSRVAFLGSHVVVVDVSSGRMLWRYPEKPFSGGGAMDMFTHDITAMFDRSNDTFVILHDDRVLLLDGATGAVLASRERLNKLSPSITAGPAQWTLTEGFFYDYGLIRLDRRQRQFGWATKFATFARDDHKGSNIARGVVDAITSVVTLTPSMGSSSTPPDYRSGRTAPPLAVDRFVLASGVGLVHVFDRETGQPVWTQDLGVPQIAQMVTDGERVFVLGGGQFVFMSGGQVSPGGEVRDPVRYGLWCLRLVDGTPVASFHSPFNTNTAARTLKTKDAFAWDEDDAWEEEEDWISEGNTYSNGKIPPPANLPFTYTKLTGLAVTDGGLVVVGTDRVWLLDRKLGREIESFSLAQIGTVIGMTKLKTGVLVRTTEGFAVFAADSGRLVTSKRIDPAPTNEAMLLFTPSSRLVAENHSATLLGPNLIPSRSSWMSQEILKPGSYWVSAAGDTIILTAKGPKLVAFDITTGKSLWELPIVVQSMNPDMTKMLSGFAGKIALKNMPAEQKAMMEKKTVPTAITIDTYDNMQILYLFAGGSLEAYILPSR